MPPLIASALRLYHSSIGKKILVALTGAGLILFLIGHLLGNLQVFLGAETLNAYAKKLHDLGPLLWVARIGLLVMLVVHIVATVQLTSLNKFARSQKYAVDATRKATKSSRIMIVSGLTILAFVIYHLMHFTVAQTNGYYEPGTARYWLADGSHNVYNMVIDGFSVWYVSLFYIIALFLLCSHLSHGFASVFQTLGLSSPRTRPAIQGAGRVFAWGLFLGNISMPLAVLFGLIH